MAQPNILMVSWDSARADHLKFHGYDRDTTPVLSKIAEDALVFEDAQVPGVGTSTSFSGIFTGRHTPAVQSNYDPAHWKAANAGRTMVAEALQEEGYYTGAVHANARVSRTYGFDRGWDEFHDYMWTKGGQEGADRRWSDFKKNTVLPLLRKLNVHSDVIYLRNILLKRESYASWESIYEDIEGFVESAPEPWFLWILLVDTHHPWFPPEEYHVWPQAGYRRTYFWTYLMHNFPGIVGERREVIVNSYDNELRHADAFLSRLEETLEAEGYEDVPTIIHSDHGDELGEHGVYGHHNEMYDTVTRVPLVIRNVGRRGRLEGPFSLKRLGSTVLDIAGSAERLGGQPSLLESAESAPVTVENRLADGDLSAAVVGPEWKVLYQPWTGFEAYHRPTDPREQTDRWGEHPEELERRLREHLEDARAEGPVDSTGEEGDIADVQERLADLGYID